MLIYYDKLMNNLGIKNKQFVHQNALWHKVVTGILYNSQKKKLYFQTIYPKKSYNFDRPDYIDFSIGGHIEKNESVLDALIREGREELGLCSETLNSAIHISTRRIIANPSEFYKIREFQYIYLIPTHFNLEDFDLKSADSEVKSVIEINLDDFILLIDKDIEFCNIREKIFNQTNRLDFTIQDSHLTLNRIIPDYLNSDFLINLLYTIKTFNTK